MSTHFRTIDPTLLCREPERLDQLLFPLHHRNIPAFSLKYRSHRFSLRLDLSLLSVTHRANFFS